ncbi:MAG TPA: GntR family transcriptional regulator [Xanthomonadales bacterium]|nr:GntR family transcriptional regulator [Xanthomonadales bacterium]
MNPESNNIIPRRSLQSEVVSRLREEIVEGIWEPGMRLQERVLCERYGVSRSPLREACRVIAAEGLLELQPNRGAVVTRPTLTDAIEYMEIVVALQTAAIRKACELASEEQLARIGKLHQQMRQASESKEIEIFFELNNQIHEAIVSASGNSALVSMHEHADRHITRLQNLSRAKEADPNLSMEEHEAFIGALLKRDGVAAADELARHLHTVTEEIRKRIAESR